MNIFNCPHYGDVGLKRAELESVFAGLAAGTSVQRDIAMTN